MPMLDPGGDIDGAAGLAQRGFLPPTFVRPVPVVVPHILGQNLTEMSLAED